MTVVSYLCACLKNPGRTRRGSSYELGKLNRISAALYRQAGDYVEFDLDKITQANPELLAYVNKVPRFPFILPLERGNGTKFEYGDFMNTAEEDAIAQDWNN